MHTILGKNFPNTFQLLHNKIGAPTYLDVNDFHWLKKVKIYLSNRKQEPFHIDKNDNIVKIFNCHLLINRSQYINYFNITTFVNFLTFRLFYNKSHT